MQNNKGIHYSAILHGAILLLMVFGLPEFLEPRKEPEPMAISVDILPVAPISNVKPQEKTPEVKEKKPVKEEKTAPKPIPEAKKEEPKKADPVPLPTEKKPDIKKPKEKKPEEKKPEKPKEDDLDSILKSVKETAKTAESKKPTEKATPANQKEAHSDRYDPSMPLSLSEIDGIRQQFDACWSVPAGAKDAQNLRVTVHTELNEDGSVIKAEFKGDSGRYASDPFFRAAADAAVRAVHRCSPLKNLPTGKYNAWRELDLNFDPKDLM